MPWCQVPVSALPTGVPIYTFTTGRVHTDVAVYYALICTFIVDRVRTDAAIYDAPICTYSTDRMQKDAS